MHDSNPSIPNYRFIKIKIYAVVFSFSMQKTQKLTLSILPSYFTIRPTFGFYFFIQLNKII